MDLEIDRALHSQILCATFKHIVRNLDAKESCSEQISECLKNLLLGYGDRNIVISSETGYSFDSNDSGPDRGPKGNLRSKFLLSPTNTVEMAAGMPTSPGCQLAPVSPTLHKQVKFQQNRSKERILRVFLHRTTERHSLKCKSQLLS